MVARAVHGVSGALRTCSRFMISRGSFAKCIVYVLLSSVVALVVIFLRLAAFPQRDLTHAMRELRQLSQSIHLNSRGLTSSPLTVDKIALVDDRFSPAIAAEVDLLAADALRDWMIHEEPQYVTDFGDRLQVLCDGYYLVIDRLRDSDSDRILIFSKQFRVLGQRIVMYASGQVVRISESEFAVKIVDDMIRRR